jgi:Protein of unknown function (DUF3800)
VNHRHIINLPMTVQVFIDDSGSDGDGETLVLAGFIGRTQDWTAFADRWQAALKRQPKIPSFKFRDFIRRENAFVPLSEAARRQKVSELVSTMAGGAFTRVSVALDLAAFRQHYEAAWADFDIGKPYCLAVLFIALAVAREVQDKPHPDTCDIILDDQVILGPRAKRWYVLMREQWMAPTIKALLPSTLIFRNDEDSAALQAADLYAGLVRSSRGETVGGFDAHLSRLLAMCSGMNVRQWADMRALASCVARAWTEVVKAGGGLVAIRGFVPIAERLRKHLTDIGGDQTAEEMLEPMFTATDRAVADAVVKVPDDSDGLGWLRKELSAVTAISEHSGKVGPELLVGQHRTSPSGPMSREQLARAIELLGEKSLDAFQQKLAKRRRNAAKKGKRHK